MSEEKECAGNEEKEYDNTDCLRKLGEAFADMVEGTVEIPNRSCDDVRKFLERLEEAQEKTRNSNIHFG